MRKSEALFTALVATIILLIALVPVAAWAAPVPGEEVDALARTLTSGDTLRGVTMRPQTAEVYLDLAGSQSMDAIADLSRLEVEAFILGKKALAQWPAVNVVRVRVHYPKWRGQSDPAMDLIVARHPGQGGKYRSLGYARPLHLIGGWGEEPVMVRYRPDIFELFRQQMVDVRQLGWRH